MERWGRGEGSFDLNLHLTNVTALDTNRQKEEELEGSWRGLVSDLCAHFLLSVTSLGAKSQEQQVNCAHAKTLYVCVCVDRIFFFFADFAFDTYFVLTTPDRKWVACGGDAWLRHFRSAATLLLPAAFLIFVSAAKRLQETFARVGS